MADNQENSPVGDTLGGGQGGGSSNQGGNGGPRGVNFNTPGGAGNSLNAPLYILNAKKKILSVINPYGYFTDMSKKDQRSCYKDAVTPADGFKPLDVNVSNSKSIVEFLTNLVVRHC